MNNEKYIGVFDSGFGGLSVLRLLIQKFPTENFIFYGDSVNAPYGTKDKNTIIELVKKSVYSLLKINPNIKLLVLACNTATVSSIDELKKEFPHIKIIGTKPSLHVLIEPSTILKSKTSHISFIDKKLNVNIDKNKKKVLILSTAATKNSKFLNDEINNYKKFFDIQVISAPEIVYYVENMMVDSDECDEYIKNILYNQNDIDYLMLACTHFPFAAHIIKKYINENATIIDNGEITVDNVTKYLKNNTNDNEYNNRYIKIIDTQGGYDREKMYTKLLSNANIEFLNQ